MSENLRVLRGVLFLKIRVKIARTSSKFKPPPLPNDFVTRKFQSNRSIKKFRQHDEKTCNGVHIVQKLSLSAKSFESRKKLPSKGVICNRKSPLTSPQAKLLKYIFWP